MLVPICTWRVTPLPLYTAASILDDPLRQLRMCLMIAPRTIKPLVSSFLIFCCYLICLKARKISSQKMRDLENICHFVLGTVQWLRLINIWFYNVQCIIMHNFPSYRNQWMYFQAKSIYWFLIHGTIAC